MIDFEENMNLVPFTVHRYFPHLVCDEDAFQEGYIVLWKACVGYVSSKGAFSTYAVRAISNAMRTYMRDNATGIPAHCCCELDANSAKTISELDPHYSGVDAREVVDKFKLTLSARDLDMLEMRMEGYALRLIAQKHGVSHQFISKRLKHIRAKLARYLDEDPAV